MCNFESRTHTVTFSHTLTWVKGFFLHVVSAISKLDAFRVGNKFKLQLVMPPKTMCGYQRKPLCNCKWPLISFTLK